MSRDDKDKRRVWVVEHRSDRFDFDWKPTECGVSDTEKRGRDILETEVLEDGKRWYEFRLVSYLSEAVVANEERCECDCDCC